MRVTTRSERENAVARLWQEHILALFPSGQRGKVLAGTDMVLLDTYTAGCVSTWQKNHGSLDEGRHRILLSCLEDLDKILPLLTDAHEVRYYQRLHDLAKLTSATGPDIGSRKCHQPTPADGRRPTDPPSGHDLTNPDPRAAHSPGRPQEPR